jgi:hypothetical protein
MPGCLVTNHTDGFGHMYSDCYPLGMPGNGATYSSNMALDAANADTNQTGTATSGWQCPVRSTTNYQLSVCKSVDPSGATGTCTCWVYGAVGNQLSTIGHVYNSSGTGKDVGCRCVLSTDTVWN